MAMALARGFSPSSRSPRSMDDASVALRRRLADESGGRDAARLALQHFQRTAEFYRQQLGALASSGDRTEVAARMHRAMELLRSLEAELRAGPGVEPDWRSPARSYDILRQSMEDAQRRCESLSLDMVQQTDAHDELEDSLCTVKDANRRLLEQIQAQSDEITRLTGQRIADEEHMDLATRQHRDDHERIRLDAQTQLRDVQASSREHRQMLVGGFSDKFGGIQTTLEILRQDVAQLRQLQSRTRADAVALGDAAQAHLQNVERDVGQKCEAHMGAHGTRSLAVHEGAQDLQTQVHAERGRRCAEGLHWGRQCGSLAARAEHGGGTAARELAHLGSHHQASDRALAAERQERTEDRGRLEQHEGESALHLLERRDAFETLQREIIHLETAVSALESEVRSMEDSAAELKRHLRESDDALAAAVSSNEHLTAQMEEQRRRLHDKNEQDLAESRATFERKLARGTARVKADIAAASKQLHAMETDAGQKDGEIQALRAEAEEVAGDHEGLKQSVDDRQAEHGQARDELEAHERDLGEVRQSHACERARGQATAEELRHHAAALEEDILGAREHLASLSRSGAAREAERGTHLAASEERHRSMTQHLSELRRRHVESRSLGAVVSQDHGVVADSAVELHVALASMLEGKQQLLADERRRLAEELGAESRNADAAQEQFERERAASLEMLRRTQEESRSRVATAEHGVSRAHESSQQGVAEAHHDATQLQSHLELLEQDIEKTKVLLRESEQNMVWIRQEADREECEATLSGREIDTDLRNVSSALEQSMREEASLGSQLEAMDQRHDRERLVLSREFEDARRPNPDSEAARLQRTISDTALLASRKSELAGTMASDGSLEKAGLANLHTRLDSQISRLQAQTDDLGRMAWSSSGTLASAASTGALPQQASPSSPTRPAAPSSQASPSPGRLGSTTSAAATPSRVQGRLSAPGGPVLGNRRALTIGINYISNRKNSLAGCINDSDTFLGLLREELGYSSADIRQLRDDRPQAMPTRKNMIAAMRWLVKGAKEGDHLFFHYSGHGSQQQCEDGDEADGMDETIVPVDFQQAGMITDDELRRTLVLPLPRGVRLTAVLDCCHSGSAIDLPYTVRHGADGKSLELLKADTQKVPATTQADVIMLSGCKDSQTSADIGAGQAGNAKAAGALSTALKATLARRPEATYKELLSDVRDFLKKGGYSQLPQLSSEHFLCLTDSFMPRPGASSPAPAVPQPLRPVTRRALTIGINYFSLPPGRGQLTGCINDSVTMAGIVKDTFNIQDSQIQCLRDDRPGAMPTRSNMLSAFRWLTEGAGPGDELFFHYSGHGGQTEDRTGDEADGMDETIMPCDFQTAGQITDDDLYGALVTTLPAGCKMWVVLDCCHSGTALDLRHKVKINPDGSASFAEVEKKGRGDAAEAGGDVVMISGCKDSQTSADVSSSAVARASGAMTAAFRHCISPTIPCLDLLVRMREFLVRNRYDQVPQMSSEHFVQLESSFVRYQGRRAAASSRNLGRGLPASPLLRSWE